MTRMLTKLGCHIDTASDGQQALDMVLGGDPDRPYDFISLDNYMPVMTGEEAVKELRERGRKDLVVGCTGTALTEDQASYLAAGADRVLAKPIMLKCVPSVSRRVPGH
jgi:CheY-like chemotaxis protein